MAPVARPPRSLFGILIALIVLGACSEAAEPPGRDAGPEASAGDASPDGPDALGLDRTPAVDTPDVGGDRVGPQDIGGDRALDAERDAPADSASDWALDRPDTAVDAPDAVDAPTEVVDGSASDGPGDALPAPCDADIASDPANCGRCGNRCPSGSNGRAVCSGSRCELVCSPGFGNCDGTAANGCEINLTTTVGHCGRCGNVCPMPGAVTACVEGACRITSCTPGLADCDGDAANGCERSLSTDAANCGMCGRMCALPHTEAHLCRDGSCAPAPSGCAFGYADCDGVPANGCEANLLSVDHCSVCGRSCRYPNAESSCTGGSCRFVACDPGFGNCDGVVTNGCEIDFRSSASHCGRCSNPCPAERPVCRLGSCVAP